MVTGQGKIAKVHYSVSKLNYSEVSNNHSVCVYLIPRNILFWIISPVLKELRTNIDNVIKFNRLHIWHLRVGVHQCL